MQIVKEYKTRAKWALGIDKGLPVLGYYSGGKPAPHWQHKGKSKMLPAGQNVILEGILFPEGVGRGRSSVSFYFQDLRDNGFHFSASGTHDFLNMVLAGDITVVEHNGRNGYHGFWTCSKQGTEVSLTPMKKEDAAKILA